MDDQKGKYLQKRLVCHDSRSKAKVIAVKYLEVCDNIL